MLGHEVRKEEVKIPKALVRGYIPSQPTLQGPGTK